MEVHLHKNFLSVCSGYLLFIIGIEFIALLIAQTIINFDKVGLSHIKNESYSKLGNEPHDQ